MSNKLHYAVMSPYWCTPTEVEEIGGNIVGLIYIYQSKEDAEENSKNPFEIMPIQKEE